MVWWFIGRANSIIFLYNGLNSNRYWNLYEEGLIEMDFTLVEGNGVNKAYEYVQAGKRLAEITWAERDGVMVMDHTYVSDTLRGQGVAKKLLDAAAQYARSQNLKMKPICSYVVSAFEKSKEYDDVKA